MEDDVEYEELLNYLRKRSEERRLTSLDQSNDAKIGRIMRVIRVGEAAKAEGKIEYSKDG